ncbi:MAG: hypothetical protein EKK45_29860 [Curvibacter sp.]|nr:MAG: hypothetical protein EKK45_29860 [Curvibacter sp.]
MEAALNHSHTVRTQAGGGQQFPALEFVNRPTVTTEQAAHYLNRRPQTLRGWACLENGPIRPIRVHGRLAWPTAQIKALVGVA